MRDAGSPHFGGGRFPGDHHPPRNPSDPDPHRAPRAPAAASAELYEIPEAGHTAGLAARPAEYEARVTAFLDEVVGADEQAR